MDASLLEGPGHWLRGGLFVVRRIVDAHGARIELDSLPGAGSTFRIYLPMRELPALRTA